MEQAVIGNREADLNFRKILIVDLGHLSKFGEKIASFSHFRWAYLGENTAIFYQLKKLLPDFGEYTEIGRCFQETATEIRKSFLDFDELLDANQDDLVWASTHLLEMSPLNSKLFGKVCRVLSVKKLLAQHSENFVLFVDDDFLGIFLKPSHSQ